ncbi:MAG: cytidine deaminase [Gammaproteobacteria bacterium]|nr:cytidine deaminase [Gammaproteobacteria bacterium]MDH5303836.1 cytidine deaminase [Gammaproteobacteria bacterium]MDH5323693.1 cytidine deaminase [Gammaproteobacteria bacterium]
MTDEELLDAARTVREMAYTPYSKFRVGAAIIDDHGNVHVGCNVENAAYPQGSCAEAGAISAMVASGGQRIVTIAVVGGGEKTGACTPCGGCRQRISEFADEATRIIIKDNDNEWHTYSLAELLPSSFHL